MSSSCMATTRLMLAVVMPLSMTVLWCFSSSAHSASPGDGFRSPPENAATGPAVPSRGPSAAIAALLKHVDAERLGGDLFYLCKSPLPWRKANARLAGHEKSTLEEADDFLTERLRKLGYEPWKEAAKAQAFGFDASKPRARAYAPPRPDAPWYELQNVYAERRGHSRPEEIILLVAHKDSQSWIDSPGAYDNGVGTVAILELARLLADYPNQRTIRFLWCNEEHRPWTSVTAAANAKARGDRLIAIFNVDGIGGKSRTEMDAGRKTNVTLYTTPEGQCLADLVTRVNELYKIGLQQRAEKRRAPGDDDGSFVKAGFPAAVANIGSFPYADANYHDLGDTADKVDITNVRLAAQVVLAAVLHTDRDGAP